MVRHNNQLPHNLPQLQNLIKRDPESYKEEFLHQYKNFNSALEIFRSTPDKLDKDLEDLSTFLAQVAHCYQDVLETFPQQIINILEQHNTVLDSNMRMTFSKALVLLRNKGLLEPTALLEPFFKLLQCHDKSLRKFIKTHIVTDIKNVNAKHKNAKVNGTLQNFMFTMLKDTNARCAKMSIDIMIELYKKNVWNDAKTVNVIASGCFSKVSKVMVTSLKFFLGSDPEEKNDSDTEDDEPDIKQVIMSNKVNKKTKKREKQLKKVKQIYVKSKKKKAQAPQFNFSALHLIYDPQNFAEKLFKQLEKIDWFDIKIMALDVISRLIGLHRLFLLNFYPYIQRFLQPHQREVTKLLLFISQASHELLPPDVLEPVLKTLVNNFVTERNSTDVMAIGLNAVREICSRCPLAMNEDLLRDLVQYKHYRERSVMMAARSLITLFRNTIPHLLHKKDRGRPTEATISLETLKYGETSALDFIPGAEILLEKSRNDLVQIDSDNSNDEDEWIDVKHSSDEEHSSNCNTNSDAESDEQEFEDEGKAETHEDLDDVRNKSEETTNKEKSNNTDIKQIPKFSKLQCKKRKLDKTSEHKKSETVKYSAEKKMIASEMSSKFLFDDEHFQRIDIESAKKQTVFAKRGIKRSFEDHEEVRLQDIENIYKKAKHDKQARLESVKKGQMERDTYGYKDGRKNPNCSKTNRERKKNKAYQMVKHKIRTKTKRSFKDKQIALRNHLLKQKKMR